MVSVVIPCHNAAETIAPCLKGLLAQDYPSYEIIVVDDNSDNGTAAILGNITGIRLLKNASNHGPAYSRNRGIIEAGGEIILLIDSDSLIEDRDLISKHAAAHRASSNRIVGGGIEGVGKGPVAKADNYSHWFLNIPHSADRVGTHLVTNNMSMRRDLFNRIGKFDESLRTGEDTDFCERALRAGYILALRSDAVVKHRDRERLGDFIGCFYRAGIDRVPARRKNKYRYWFLLPSGFLSSLVYCLPLAILLSLQVAQAWFKYDKKVILYFPLIFAGRLAMTSGIVRYYFQERFLRR